MIVFDRLSKHYGALKAVDGLSLTVQPGEVYALLGPNGAGKTSALRCLATLIRPTGGTALVDGADVIRSPLQVRRKIGFLAASMGLYERLTARELVAYFADLQGVGNGHGSGSRDDRVDQMIETFGLGEFADRYCGRLSTGQRQRVSIARAMVHDPPALILDEPTLGLDVVSGQAIREFIREERRLGKAILFSTHQMAEVELLADRIGVLDRGRVIAEGTLAELLELTGTDNLPRAFLALIQGSSR